MHSVWQGDMGICEIHKEFFKNIVTRNIDLLPFTFITLSFELASDIAALSFNFAFCCFAFHVTCERMWMPFEWTGTILTKYQPLGDGKSSSFPQHLSQVCKMGHTIDRCIVLHTLTNFSMKIVYMGEVSIGMNKRRVWWITWPSTAVFLLLVHPLLKSLFKSQTITT